MSNSDELEVVLQTEPRTILGEGNLNLMLFNNQKGPHWDHSKQILYWIDIRGFKIHIYNPSTNTNDTIPTDQYVGAGNKVTSRLAYK